MLRPTIAPIIAKISATLLVLCCALLTLPPAYAASPIRQITTDNCSFIRLGCGWSPDGKHIIFSKQYTEGVQLWIMKADGTGARAISKVGWEEHWGWSPDSKKFVFAYADKRDDNMEGTLFIYDVPTDQTRPLATGFTWGQFEETPGWDMLEWSKDSQLVVMQIRRTKEAIDRIDSYLIDVNTGKMTGLTPNNYTTGVMYAGAWSPDSSYFVMTSRLLQSSVRQLWVCKRDGSDLHPITSNESGCDVTSDPRWSPDGQWLAFCTTKGRTQDEINNGQGDVWLIHPDGTGAHPVTHGSDASLAKRIYFGDPQWAYGGQYIICSTRRWNDNGRNIDGMTLIEVKTGATTPIVEDNSTTDQSLNNWRNMFTISPDGKSAALTVDQYTVAGRQTNAPHNQDERTFLYRYDFATKKLIELAHAAPKEDGISYDLYSNTYYWRPDWSPDSTKLLFVTGKVTSYENRSLDPNLYVYQFDTEPSPIPGELPPAMATPPVMMPPVVAPTMPIPPAVLPAPGSQQALATVVIPLHCRRVVEVAAALPQIYAGMFKIDPDMNAFVVSPADTALLCSFERDVAMLDHTVPLVTVDVLVTDLTKDATNELGLSWQYAKGQFAASLPTLPDGVSPGQIIYQGVGKLNQQFFVTLSALVEQDKAQVQASPRIVTRSGAQATINIRRTDNFLYVAGTDSSGNPYKTRSDISADTILKIQPIVLDSNKIALSLDATVDSFVFGSAENQNANLPNTTRRQAVTDLVVEDNATVIIGGLTLLEDTVKKQKTPFLGDLPVLGAFFRNNCHTTHESTIVIFVTPHIVKDGENCPCPPEGSAIVDPVTPKQPARK